MRTPAAAWGGAAAELQTPPSTVREAMQADEIQVRMLPYFGPLMRPVMPSLVALGYSHVRHPASMGR